MSREEALKKVKKKENDRPVFVVTYNPALPSISGILKKHWRVLSKDPYLKTVFPSPPMVAYRRAKNLKDKLVRAKVPPPPTREKRKIVGMKPCNKNNCETCPFVRLGKEFKNPFNQTKFKINSALDCTSKNAVYCLFCNKPGCSKIYVGQTQRELRERFSEHKTSVRTKSKKVVGQHFSGPGHTLANMEIMAIEKVFTKGTKFIEKRESMWIEKLEAEFKGLNKMQ